MTTEIILRNFGSNSSSAVAYSPNVNAYLTNGYVSCAGNTYFNAIRIGDGFVIKEDVGQGYLHTFLNGIRIYSLKDRKLLADKTYHKVIYSTETVKSEVCTLITDVIIEASRNEDHQPNWYEVRSAVSKLVYEAFTADQRQMLSKQNANYLAPMFAN